MSFDRPKLAKNILDVRVYQEEGVIKIAFDLITTHTKTKIWKNCLPYRLKEKYIQFWKQMEKQGMGFDVQEHFDFLQHINEIEVPRCSKIVDIIVKDAEKKRYTQATIVYQLSSNPYLALTLLGLINFYFSNLDILNINGIHFSSSKISQPFIKKTKLISMDQYIEQNYVAQFYSYHKKSQIAPRERTTILLQSILSMEKGPYGYLFKAIKKIMDMEDYNKTSAPFLGFIDILKITFLIYPKTISSFFEKNTQEDKEKKLIRVSRHLIHQNRKDELPFLFQSLDQIIIKKLYQSVLGKKAHDQRKYTWTYTEWHFLKNANFIAGSDKKIRIINLNKNHGYLKYYAKGKDNHSIFEKEIKHLFKILKLRFDINSDFHGELIFTLESTKKLQQLGLALQENIKKMIYKENFFRLFDRNHVEIDDEEKPGLNILCLPNEVFDDIQNKLEHQRTRKLAY